MSRRRRAHPRPTSIYTLTTRPNHWSKSLQFLCLIREMFSNFLCWEKGLTWNAFFSWALKSLQFSPREIMRELWSSSKKNLFQLLSTRRMQKKTFSALDLPEDIYISYSLYHTLPHTFAIVPKKSFLRSRNVSHCPPSSRLMLLNSCKIVDLTQWRIIVES